MADEGSTEAAAQGTSREGPGDHEQKKSDDSARFECNICLDTAKDAVISHCGHLFCWPCLVQWLDTRPNNQVCPVCKALISREKVIPLYGRGGDNTDPRDKMPPRPRAPRQEAPQGGFPGFNWDGVNGNGMHFSFGIGMMPFAFFANVFSTERRADAPAPGSQQHQEEQFLHNLFLYLAIFFLVWLIFL